MQFVPVYTSDSQSFDWHCSHRIAQISSLLFCKSGAKFFTLERLWNKYEGSIFIMLVNDAHLHYGGSNDIQIYILKDLSVVLVRPQTHLSERDRFFHIFQDPKLNNIWAYGYSYWILWVLSWIAIFSVWPSHWNQRIGTRTCIDFFFLNNKYVLNIIRTGQSQQILN